MFKNLLEKQKQKQKITSAETSIKQVAAIHVRNINSEFYKKGMLVLDYGGGKYDLTKERVESATGAELLVFDPFNRDAKHNQHVLKSVLKSGGANIVTIANVLNVIKEKRDRITALTIAKEHLREGGECHISIYKAARTMRYRETKRCVGQPTTKGWQLAQTIKWYLPEIEKVFGRDKTIINKGTIIIRK